MNRFEREARWPWVWRQSVLSQYLRAWPRKKSTAVLVRLGDRLVLEEEAAAVE